MPAAILLIHGFGGGRNELLRLERVLVHQGYPCTSLLLPGHDSEGRIRTGFGYRSFQAAAAGAYARLRKDHDRVIVIGFSMGGLLALQLAATFRPLGIVIINVPLLPWDLRAISHWIEVDRRINSSFHLRRLLASLLRQPPTAYLEYLKQLQATLPLLAAVHCPCLILQSEKDDTAHRYSAKAWQRLLPQAASVFRHTYHRSWHQLMQSPDARRASRDVLRFVRWLEVEEATSD